MAVTDRARDFVARFLTDTTQFDTAPVVRDLEETSTIATQTTRKIETEGGKVTSAARKVGTGAGQALAEGLSSVASGGGISGALNGIASVVGSLGLAGIGVSLGVGLVSNIVKGMEQREKDVAEAAKGLFDTIRKEGRVAAQAAAVEANLNTTVQDPDKVAMLALLGITPLEWASASAGVESSIKDVRTKLGEAEAERGVLAGDAGQKQLHALRTVSDELDKYTDALDRANTALGRLNTRASDSYLDQIYNPNSRRVGS